nr:pyocin activator PrtN family protein [Pseudomonas sp. GV085]
MDRLQLKCSTGEIDIPLTKLGANSQKAALGVHLADLATYIDRQRKKRNESKIN